MQKPDIDLLKEQDSSHNNNPKKIIWHPEKARMTLAYIVLFVIGSFFVLTCVLEIFFSNSQQINIGSVNSLFELFKTGFLPIVTLILGFYFSKGE